MAQLELGSFRVRSARFGTRTEYADGVLTIEPKAIRNLILRDGRIKDVHLHLVFPGDSVRVLRVLDAIEPLFKVSGPSCAFPGFNGPPRTCGSGRTHRLETFTVVEVGDFPFPASGVHAFEEGIIEMSGPGALYCGCSDRINLLLEFVPGEASTNLEYDDALRRASLSVAGFLAGVTRELAPPKMEVFEIGEETAGLPRLVWVHQVRAQGPMLQTHVYGHEFSGSLPTILNPNEMLDGAVVGSNYKIGTRTPTFRHTWHPSLVALYQKHGKEINFGGVIISRGHHETEFLKERSAQFVAKLAKLLGADGALCTYEATGNTHIDFMLTVQALEAAGIPTGIVVHEYGGPEGKDIPLVDFVPEAVAIASSGGIDRRLKLPPVAQVIGGTHLAHRGEPAQGELDLPIQELYAATIETNVRGVAAQGY
ncbi:MAG: glycine/sarcosine/betaine reductase component B subunit [Desulfobaccales bacterium]